MNPRMFFILTLVALPTGCAELPRNVYEGVRNRDEALRSPGDNRPAMPDYETYKRERDMAK